MMPELDYLEEGIFWFEPIDLKFDLIKKLIF